MPSNLTSQAGTISGMDRPLHATCKAFVASHERVAGDMGPGRYELSNDIISCEVTSSTQGSSANLTLMPRRPYLHWIFPGDWISIYMSSGADAREGFGVVGMREGVSDDTRVFFGMVTGGPREQLAKDEKGEAQVRFTLSCIGVQGMLDKTMVYYNQQLGPGSLFGSLLPGLATLTMGIPLTGTPATIPRSIALAYAGFGGQLLMPESYPGGFGTDEQRRARLQDSLQRSLKIEETLGILQARGANGRTNPTLTQRAIASAKSEFPARSLANILDLFTYVEDMFVSGRVVNTPRHEQNASVWGLMMENVNPIMNEMYVSLLPPRRESGERDWNQPDEDEWGMRPHLRPSLVIRERPFAWRDELYVTPGGLDGRKETEVNFGSVFFSQRGQGNKFPYQQDFNPIVKVSQAGQRVFKLITNSVRAVDRVKVRASDINQYMLGPSENDMFNFFMINMASTPLSQAHQKFTLLLDGLVPVFLPESIKRYGLRLRDMSTKFMYLGGGDVDSKQALDFLVRSIMAYDVWYQHAAWYRAGTISTRPIPAAEPGMILDVEWPTTEESFYIESVNKSFTKSQNGVGKLVTNFTVTRGQPSGFSDPQERLPYAPPDSVRVIPVNPDTGVAGTEAGRPNAPNQPVVKRDPFKTDAERVAAYSNIVQEAEATLTEEMAPGEFNNYLAELNKTPANKQVLATAQRASKTRADIGTSQTAIAKIEAEYQKQSQPRELPTVFPVKQDRLDAGRPPWALERWKNKMWIGAREFIRRIYDVIGGLLRSG